MWLCAGYGSIWARVGGHFHQKKNPYDWVIGSSARDVPPRAFHHIPRPYRGLCNRFDLGPLQRNSALTH